MPATRRSTARRIALALLAAACVAGPARAAIEEGSVEAAKRELLRSQALALENGEGIERDPAQAAKLYCEAARLGDAASQFNLGWMYSNGRGVERNDTWAAFFFHAAAEQGYEQAQRMLQQVGGAPTYVPDCMREPEPPKVAVARPSPSRRPVEPAPMLIRSNGPPSIIELVKQIAPQFKVHPQLVLSVIEVESRYDIVALSPKNAKGLMQLIPETAARFGVARPYDPAQNIRGGTAYLQLAAGLLPGRRDAGCRRLQRRRRRGEPLPRRAAVCRDAGLREQGAGAVRLLLSPVRRQRHRAVAADVGDQGHRLSTLNGAPRGGIAVAVAAAQRA